MAVAGLSSNRPKASAPGSRRCWSARGQFNTDPRLLELLLRTNQIPVNEAGF